MREDRRPSGEASSIGRGNPIEAPSVWGRLVASHGGGWGRPVGHRRHHEDGRLGCRHFGGRGGRCGGAYCLGGRQARYELGDVVSQEG